MEANAVTASPAGILVEAEAFDDPGGWVVDSQFELQMGSPYLLAHGWGTPVADASTVVDIAEAGEYRVWVRAKDWVPSHSPGRFTLSVNGTEVGGEMGANGQDWSWEQIGIVALGVGPASLALHDLTGFDGRCDAIYLTTSDAAPIDGADDDARAWRRELLGLSPHPIAGGTYDVVVVGGGIAGCVAALTVAREGRTVALVQDRPFLGGNASKEIGLSPRGENGGLVAEIASRTDDGDIAALNLLAAEPTATVFLEQRLVGLTTDEGHITAIDLRHARDSSETRLFGVVFIDTTGSAALGRLAGAELLTGRESKTEFGEHYAPDDRDDEHHGNTLFFRTAMADGPRPFPDVPWATEVSKDYANLSGQLIDVGTENGPGPAANPDSAVFDFDPDPVGAGDLPLMKTFPATHFWEYGQFLDLIDDGELIRDHLLRALYGTFSNVKRLDPAAFDNLQFDWVAHVPAQGEFTRYRGDYVLTENDIRKHTVFPDAVVRNDGAFCIHIPPQPGEGTYDFRLKDWVWDVRDNQPYTIPFRCLYSSNVPNLMMAGKHISVSRVAGTTTKLMGNGGQHGVAVGVAAAMCVEHATSPRLIGKTHLAELLERVEALTGCEHLHTATASAGRALTARQAAERHAERVLAGNIKAIQADFVGSTFMNLMAAGSLPPRPTTAYEIVSEDAVDGHVELRVRYSNDTESLELVSRWQLVSDEWKIVAATPG